MNLAWNRNQWRSAMNRLLDVTLFVPFNEIIFLIYKYKHLHVHYRHTNNEIYYVLNILMCIRPDDGDWTSKHVAENK